MTVSKFMQQNSYLTSGQMMVEFAKLKCNEQLQAILKNVTAEIDSDWFEEGHDRGFEIKYAKVDENSIKNK